MNLIYNTPILNRINIPNLQFRQATASYIEPGERVQDSFASNPLYANFVDRETLSRIAKSNQRIMQILKENNIRLNVNSQELDKLKHGHLMDTRVTAAKMYSALPQEIKSNINLSDLQQAAMLHDYGKVLIPDKILNKSSKLNDKERKIMELHSELGYELLKDQGVKENVLNLVRYHHQTPDGSGYPEIKNGFKPGISSEIIAAADKYSALREKRSYKDALSRDEALNMIKEDVEKGLISQEVYNALEKSI